MGPGCNFRGVWFRLKWSILSAYLVLRKSWRTRLMWISWLLVSSPVSAFSGSRRLLGGHRGQDRPACRGRGCCGGRGRRASRSRWCLSTNNRCLWTVLAPILLEVCTYDLQAYLQNGQFDVCLTAMRCCNCGGNSCMHVTCLTLNLLWHGLPDVA